MQPWGHSPPSPALGMGQGSPGADAAEAGAGLTRHSQILHTCAVSSSCASCLHFRKRLALQRAFWEAW